MQINYFIKIKDNNLELQNLKSYKMTIWLFEETKSKY